MDFDLQFFRSEDSHEKIMKAGKLHRASRTGRGFLAAALMLVCYKALVAQDVQRDLLPHQIQPGEISVATSAAGMMGTVMPAGSAEALPDAADQQTSAPTQNPPNPPTATPKPASSGNGFGVIALLPPPISRQRLTADDKLHIYIHQNFGPQNFILPAFSAGFIMLSPPSGYPRQWKDGGGAFGRWYGEQIVASTSNRTARLLAQVALHEDPRYVPSGSKNTMVRTLHALAFTLVDKTDSGHNTFAFSNFAGAAAGGFVGMGLLPNGYNDTAHAERRALRGLETIAIRNIITEFRPEWAPLLSKIHAPIILPAWWTPKPSPHP